MRRQKQLPQVRIEVATLACAADNAVARAFACTLLVATTLVAAILTAF
jgi:hypothetical protein